MRQKVVRWLRMPQSFGMLILIFPNGFRFQRTRHWITAVRGGAPVVTWPVPSHARPDGV